MNTNGHRGAAVITALLVGLLVGLFAGAYIFSTWLATDSIIQNTSPKFLNVDAVNRTPQYRDFYIARAATKYQRDVQMGIADPLRNAYDVLGVTTGDTSIDEAIAMVRWTKDVATQENNSNGELGQFTQEEEFNIVSLLGDLERAKMEGTFPKVDTSHYAPTVARTNNRLVGGVILVLLIGAAGALIWLMDRSSAMQSSRIAPATSTYTQQTFIQPGFINPEPAAPAKTADIGMTPMPTSANTPEMGVVSPLPSITVPSAAGEVALASFPPTDYVHGDDSYDQGFNVIGPVGELLAECGVSIADHLGQDSPAKVNVLSLWVFDKGDFNSTTKLLMTEGAMNDTGIRGKLRSKGEALLAREGDLVEIMTTSVRVEIKISDVTFNQDAPANSYFKTARFTFTAYQRSTGA